MASSRICSSGPVRSTEVRTGEVRTKGVRKGSRRGGSESALVEEKEKVVESTGEAEEIDASEGGRKTRSC